MAVPDFKKELRTLVTAIIEESDNQNGFSRNVDRATIQILQSLIDLKKAGKQPRPSSSIDPDNPVYPIEFCCPISRELMLDPVIASDGWTYDRDPFEQWIKDGNRFFPDSEELISPNVIPNHVVRDMILDWHILHKITYRSCYSPRERHGLTEKEYQRLLSLLNNLASPDPSNQQKAALKLTKKLPQYRAYFTESAVAIPKLLAVLNQPVIDSGVQRDLTTVLMDLSIHETGTRIVAETPGLLPILFASLRSRENTTKNNAATALLALSALESNRPIIGENGGLQPLIHVLEDGNMKEAASAIYNLLSDDENIARAMENGVLRVVMKKIEERVVFMEDLLRILAILSYRQDAVIEISRSGGIPLMFSVARDTNVEREKEFCMVVIHRICFTTQSHWDDCRVEDTRYRTLSTIAATGSWRAKRKAKAIMDQIRPGQPST